jgi:hypothetical protein
VLFVITSNSSFAQTNRAVVIPLQGDDIYVKGVWKGEWIDGTGYKSSDMVQSFGDSYIALSDHAGNSFSAPPNQTFWDLLASSGATGSTGARGLTGPAGTNGATGSRGLTGAAGTTGAAGPRGLTGATGVTGAIGPQGPGPYEDGKLWGQGRPGTGTLLEVQNGSLFYGLSRHVASWGSASSVCPLDSWVCRASDINGLPKTGFTEGQNVTSCSGTITKFYNYAWLADSDGASGTSSSVGSRVDYVSGSNLIVTSVGESPCISMKVMCCRN